MDPKLFKAVLGQFLSGVTVVTAVRPGPDGAPALHGMTASAFISVSMDPPLVLVSVQKKAHMHDILAQPGPFAISLLASRQDLVSNHFAGWKKAGFEPELLAAAPEGPFRTPVVDDALGWLDLDLHDTVSAGDHTLFIGRVVDLRLGDQLERGPLAYVAGKYGSFGPG